MAYATIQGPHPITMKPILHASAPSTAHARATFRQPRTLRASGAQPLHRAALAAILAAGLLYAGQASAQARETQGFSLAFNLNASGNTIDSTATDGVSYSNGGITTHSNSLGLQLQYALPLGSRGLLAAGVSSVIQGLLVGEFVPTGETVSIQGMNSFYLAPGFFVTEHTQLYAKVAAVSARTSFGGGNAVTGTGGGIGAQYWASNNVFLQAELMQNIFRDSDHNYVGLQFSDKYTANLLSVSLGYKF